jgi:hypothetical protein
MVMPKEGIFVGFERLKIEKNRYEKTIRDANTSSNIIQTVFCPFVLYNKVEREYTYNFSSGNWKREPAANVRDSANATMVYEPAINLILVN